MNITINDRRIDYVLDGESNLGDVVSSVESLAKENGNIIESISVDDRLIPFDFESQEFRKRVDELGDVRIVTSTKPELALDSIGTVGEFVESLLLRLKGFEGPEGSAACLAASLSIGPEQNDELLEAVSLLLEAVESSLKLLGIRPKLIASAGGEGASSTASKDGTLSGLLFEIAGFLTVYERRYIDREGIVRLKEVLGAMPPCLDRVMRWAVVKNPGLLFAEGRPLVPKNGAYAVLLRETLSEICALSRRSAGKFEMIARNLQTGNDGRALSELAVMTELFDEIVAILKLAKDHADAGRVREAEEVFSAITFHLVEAEGALRAGDMITLGDELEYKVKPLFERFLDIFENLYFSIDTGEFS
jgi:hypothetical protein